MPNPTTAVDHVTGPLHAGKGDVVVQYGAPPAPQPEAPAFRVLTVVARPLDQQALPEIGDAWSLADGLARADLPLDLAFARPPTPETARRRLAEGWDVLHFDGHGVWAWACACGAFIPKDEKQPDPTACPRCDAPLTQPAAGYLAFEQEDGLAHLFPAAELAALLCPSGSPPRTRLAILTACQSAMGQPSLADVLLQAGVPAVLAMRQSVTVQVVAALLPPFYANLAAGRTPRQALDAALPALHALGYPSFSGAPWEQVPALVGTGADAPLCAPGCHAAPRVEHEPLVGVPAPSSSGAFHGDFAPGEPPAGRKGYLARLARTLARGEKLVVLTGVGGVGKSALAAAAARRLAWRYPGGVFWVDGRDYLETRMRLENALAVFAAVYGGEYLKLPAARQRDLAFEHLRRIEAPALVVVDNADVADEAVWRFLRDVPRPSAVLATTRTAPEYGGSVVPVEVLTPAEGLTFLAAEIGRRQNEPRWTAGLDGAAKGKLLEIARLLDGHALALLIAAALVGEMGLDYALKQARDNPSRGETERRFDFSYEPLPESRKDLLHRLAAFAADFDLDAVRAMATVEDEGVKPLPPWDADLPELVRGSFVERHVLPPDTVRFRLHPVMRDYVRRKAEPEALAVHERRMAGYFTAWADVAARQLGDTGTALVAVRMADLEQANLLAAQEVCLAQEMRDAAVSLAYDLDVLFERSGDWAARRRALQAGIAAARQGGQRRDEAGLAHNLGTLAYQQGDYAEARRLYGEALEIAQQLGDRAGIATTLHNLGALAQDTGEYGEARRLYGESLAIEQQLGNRAGVAVTVWNLGNVAYLQGDLNAAKSQYQDALAEFKELGDLKNEAGVLHQLGMLAQATGEYGEARQLYGESLAIAQQLGDRAGVAQTLHELGRLAENQGEYGEARRLYGESLAIKQQLGDRAGVARTLHQLGGLAQNQGEYGEARRLYGESLEIEQQLGNRAGVAKTIFQLGRLLEVDGELDEALALYRESMQVDVELGNLPDLAIDYETIGRVLVAKGQMTEGTDLLKQAAALYERLGLAKKAQRVRERLEGLSTDS